MNELNPLEIVTDKIFQGRFRNINAGTIRERNLHYPSQVFSSNRCFGCSHGCKICSRDNLLSMSQVLEELLNQAARARREDRPEDAKRDLLQALEICRESGTKTGLAKTLKALGQIERDMGRGEVALPLYEQAAAIYRAEGDALALAHTIRHVADIQRNLGRTAVAEPLYREALAIYRCHTETPALDLANAIRGLAIVTFDTGKREEARLLWQETRELYASVNVQAGVSESSRRLALLEQE